MRTSGFLILVVWLLSATSGLLAQESYYLPMNERARIFYEDQLFRPSLKMHTAIRPIPRSDLFEQEVEYPEAFYELGESVKIHNVYQTRLGTLPKFQYQIFPVLDIATGFDGTKFHDKLTYDFGVGLGTQFNWNKKFNLSANYLWGYRQLPYQEDSLRARTGHISGHNALVPFKNGYQDHWMEGAFSYDPSENFRLEVGNGRHFLGEGYRSLFLSDHTSAYPYGKIDVKVWRLKYSILYSWYKDRQVGNSVPGITQDKFSTIHYLSLNITKNINVGLFEAVIWQGEDSLSGRRGFDVNYLNPVVFFRPVEYAQGSADNVLLGLSINAKINDHHQVYSQLLLDEFNFAILKSDSSKWWGNKFGAQIGYKAHGAFGIKDFFYRVEYNWVRPFTYAHGTNMVNYGHDGLPLAHPLGANLSELLIHVRKSWNRTTLGGEFLWAYYGRDQDSVSFGGDPFNPYTNRSAQFGYELGSGYPHQLHSIRAYFEYIVYPKSAVTAGLSFQLRRDDHPVDKVTTPFINFYLRTNLWNRYRDI